MKKLFLIAITLILSVGVMAQQKIQLRSVDKVECGRSDMSGLHASFSFSSLEASKIETTRGEFSEIYIEGAYPNGNVGEPQLPMFTRLIAIPTGATPLVTVGSHSETEYTLSDFGIGTVAAMQAPIHKSVDPSTVEYAFSEAAYARDSYNDDPIAMVEVLGTMRGITLGRLIVQPVRYNPVAGTVKVYNDVEVNVDFQNGDAESTTRMFKSTANVAFQSVYDQIFNMDMLMGGTRDAYTDHPDFYNTPVKMLVICYSGFQGNAALNSWLEWKLQKGYYVDIYYTSETGTTASAIASFIKTKYNASVSAGNAYTYLIVIGDTGQVPQYMNKNIDSDIGNCASDLGYASVNFSSSTSNYFPDMYYSRISVENTTHLTNYINKVLTYEKYEFTDGGNYLNNVILVGGWDSNWTSRVAKPTINYGTNYYFNSSNTTYGGFSGGTINATISTSSTAGYSGTNNGCYNGINNGVCFLNYTAHGDKQEWYQPKMTAAHVATLTNTGKYFFGVGNCCLTGNFNNTTTTYSPGSAIGTNACFAETMIRVPNAGAIAYVGCSPYSYWYEDFYWAVGAHSYSQGNYPTTTASSKGVYDVMFMDQYWNSASALNYVGNLAVQQAVSNSNTNSSITSGNCSNSAHYYFQFYHTFGDGSVMPYVTKPETNTVTIPGTVTPGTTSITVNAVAGSYVAVTDNSSVIYGVAQANSSGVATVNFTNAIPNSGTLYVVVTRQQYQPYFGTITVQGGTQYTISASANPTASGMVSGAGQYYGNTECTLTAIANNHYEFSKWTKNGTQVSTNNPYTFTVTGNATYVAQFTALSPHTVTCATVQNGTISATPTTAYKNETVYLTATPDPGYFLGEWTVTAGNQTIPVTNNQFTMPDSNVTVSATFVPGYTVTVVPATNGSVSASPTNCAAGTTVNLTATPASGYTLDSWVVYRTGDVNTNVTVNGNSFTMPAYDVTVVGIFSPTSSGEVTIGSIADNTTGWALPTHVYYGYSMTQQIYTAAEVGGAGTITAISFYYLGSSTSGTAATSGSRTFNIYMSNTSASSLESNWVNETSNHLVYSGTQTFNSLGWYTFTLSTPFEYDGTSNLLLTFDDNTGSYSVNARRYFRTYSTGQARARYIDSDSNNFDPTAATSLTSSSGSYNTTCTDNNIIKLAKTSAGSNAVISVSPNALSGFTYPEGQGPSESQSVAVIGRNLQSNMTVTAPTHYEVCLTAGGTYASSLSIAPSSGSVQKTVYVRMKDGLAQGNYNNEALVFTSGSTTQNVTLSGSVAEGAGTYYTITVAADPETGGSVNGGGRYLEGTNVTLTATSATGYSFVNWTKNGTQVSTSLSFEITVNEAATYVAHFSRNSYMIQASANPTEGGTVTGAGSYYEGTPVTLTATANMGYTFVNWTSNGAVVSTEPSITFNVTSGGSYVANFEVVASHTVTVNQAEGGTITATPTTAYTGDVVTLTVTANTGYFFVEWDVRDANNQPVAVNSDNTFIMPNSDVTVTAVFSEGFVVTVAEVEHGSIAASQVTAQPGDVITLTATPDIDCNFSTWYVFKTGDTRTLVTVVNNQFTMPAYDVTVMAVFKTVEIEDITIGSGTSTNKYLPTYAYYKYSLTQQIYTAEEVGTAGTITAIAFKVSNNKSTTRTLDIYIRPTSKTAFESTTDWETMGPIYKVFSGSVNFSASGWTTIELTTPFEYDGVKNLNLCVVDNTGTYVSGNNGSNAPQFYVYSTGANRAMYVYTDNSAYTVGYSNTISGYTGTQSTSNDQVTFTMTVEGSAESLTVTPNTINGFSYEEGNGPSDPRKLDLVGVDLSDDITLTAPSDFEICATINGTYGQTLSIARESAKSRTVTTWDFEGTFLNWTTIDADGDGNDWMVTTELISSFESGHSGTNALSSQSYASGTGALTPDNWLVSPQVTLGGTFTMWACAQDASWPAEHFGIFVSTTSNTNTSSFTMLNEWTLVAKGGAKGGDGPRGSRGMGDWYQFTVDLSAYAGQTGYIAVRHFNCTDFFYLNVDDFTLDTEAGYTPELPVVITPATVYVRMKGGLSVGDYSGTLAANTGAITSNVNLGGAVTQVNQSEQTIMLHQGMNWWSTYLGITLAELEDAIANALGANGTATIKSASGEFITYTNGGWRPSVMPFDIREMYKIQVNADCAITLTGVAVDPSEYEITIHYGNNWIGCLTGESISVAEAFAGLSPEIGDVVKSKTGSATYYSTGWRGELQTLEPGQGYMYQSKAAENKTFYFGTNSSK